MSAWYSSAWKKRVPVSISILGGAGTAGTYDAQFTVPKDWDEFWDNIKSDGFDAIVVDADNNLLTFTRVTFTYASRVLEIGIDNWTVDNNNAIQMIWLYFNNPAATDLSSAFVPSTPKSGLVFVGTPSNRIVGYENPRTNATNTPIMTFTKTTDEAVWVWFQTGPYMSRRIDAYNGKKAFECIKYVQSEAFAKAGSPVALTIDQEKTRFINGWTGMFISAGTVDFNYTIALKVFTTLGQIFSLRAGIQVRNKIPT